MEEGTRHCAFCLIPIAAKDVKNCGKCLRRVYCSQKCQKKDWKSKKASAPIISPFLPMETLGAEGQGHKDGCGVPVCEEDLDWVVKDGGKGVVAKRLILKGERIILGNAAQYKERTEKSAPFGMGECMLFNHACDANSSMNKGIDYQVSIITAVKDIQPGTEITYNYVGFGEDEGSIPINSFEESREALESRYGITCPEDCFCYNKEIEKIFIKRHRVLYARADPFAGVAIADLQNVIADFDVVSGDRLRKAQMISVFLVIQRKIRKFLNLTQIYKKEADDIFKSVFHPESPYSKVETWIDRFGFWKYKRCT